MISIEQGYLRYIYMQKSWEALALTLTCNLSEAPDQYKHLVLHLKAPIHIHLVSESQGLDMTFDCNFTV